MQSEMTSVSMDLDKLPVSELVKMFEDGLSEIFLKVSETAFILLAIEKRPEAAEIVRKLRRRPIVEAVRNVGIGTLIKEAFADYYSRPDVLRAMTAIPVEKQRELVEVGSVKVYDHLSGGDTHRMVEIEKLTTQELALVFDSREHRVREPIEQAKLIASRRLKEKLIKSEISHDARSGLMNAKNAAPHEIQAYIKKHGLG